ncbi:MAG: cytochrome-c peroxidase [Planctomycetota bacterium]|nr:cytochrome-c peroxidase [Planctomycetota bacterium]MDA1213124.1 cytochrome-c peroxidase [Planctomycetota bacterium]
MRTSIFHIPVSIGFMLFAATSLHSEERSQNKRELVPLPRSIPSPEDNPFTEAKVSLGKQLFFDPRLSGNNTMSCATCHLPEKAFGDGLARAKGHNEKRLARNTQTVLNVGFYTRYFWDGRAESLEAQALEPIASPDEMNQNLDDLERELNDISGYKRQFQDVFGTTVTRDGIAKALAAFQRTLITKPSPFDRYLAGDKNALKADEIRGLELFRGAAGCIRCHHGPLLSDSKFYRLGVSFRDVGLAGVTQNPEDKGKFRTPTLRNIADTGPYMHNGSMETLDDVVTFYYRGVPRKTPDELPLDIVPISGQSFSEISDIVAFLKTLSGDPPLVEPEQLP